MTGHDASTVALVGGAPRSGTTLMRLVLSAHPDIEISPECHFVGDVVRRGWAPHEPVRGTRKEAFRQLVEEDEKFQTWPDFVWEEAWERMEEEDPLTPAKAFLIAFRRFGRRTGGNPAIVGNKRGLYARGSASYLREAFGDPRFVFILRDPRDVARSIVENLDMHDRSDALAIPSYYWHRIREEKEANPESVHVLRYEDLVRNPDGICSDLCEFLGVEYHEGMTRFYDKNQGNEQLMGATEEIHPHTSSPLKESLIGQWRDSDTLSQQDILQVERLSSRMMDWAGYEKENEVGVVDGLVGWWARTRYSLKLMQQSVLAGLRRNP